MSAQAIRLTDVDIENALSGHLDVVFQPVFSLRDGALMRVETFVRWEHPGLGVLPPGAFISFFEAQGRMGELTRYVLRGAVSAYRDWRGTAGPGLSINLAQSDVSDPTFASDLLAILSEAGLPPSLVTLECPPFAPDTAPADAALMLGRLARTGCPLSAEVRGRAGDVVAALDPFPFAEVKTGGSAILRFARTAKGGPGLTAISELLDLAGSHGARAIAVGVEDEASARALASLGFDGGQGKLFGGTGGLAEVSGEAVNLVRATLGLDALDDAALSDLADQPAPAAPAPAKLAPLILDDDVGVPGDQAGSSPDDAPLDPNAPDPTMMAIMRLKAKKIAAKKAALKRAEADKARAEAEAETRAAHQATDTARRLQERLASEMDPPSATPAPKSATPASAPSTPKRLETAAPQDDERAASISAPAATTLAAEEDAEAGVLLSQNLAEIALGVSRQSSFAEGLRLDGYAPSGGNGAQTALLGAVAPEAEPDVRTGEAAPAEFVDVASAIHGILAELPVPEDAKPRLLHSAEKPLTNRGSATPDNPVSTEAVAIEAAVPLDRTVGTEGMAATVSAELLTEDLSDADTLDAVVATCAVLDDDTPDGASDIIGPTTEGAERMVSRQRRRRKTNVLTRKYKITHFWPRRWVRIANQVKANRAVRAEERIGDAEALAA